MNILKITSVATALILSTSVNAALVGRLGGLAYYDDVANLTWLADANAAGGTMTWENANTWAIGLDIAGVTGWRLPGTPQLDSTCSAQTGSKSYGFNCHGSEIGNLFYNVLGGTVGHSLTTTHNANYTLFNNLQSGNYWSATEDASDTGDAWLFGTSLGSQANDKKSRQFYALAVHSGDVSAVPVPAAVWLLGSGFLGFVGLARRKKDRPAHI